VTLQPGQGREDHRPAHHTPREHDQAPNHGADEENKGQEDDGMKYGHGVACGGGVLVQVSAEDDYAAADGGLTGERHIPAEDQHIAAHGTIEEDISGKSAHAARGASVKVDRTENAARIVELLVRRQGKVAANVDYVR